jgi:hypothetical protein
MGKQGEVMPGSRRSSERKTGLRLVAAGVAFVFFMGSVVYYGAFIIRYHEGSRMLALAKALDVEAKEKGLSLARRQYLKNVYGPAIANARKEFLQLPGYWKDIHVYYLAVASLWAGEGRIRSALYAVRSSLRYHPYFANGYELIGQLYDSLGVSSHAETCRQISARILGGEHMGLKDVDGCIWGEAVH